MAKPNAPIIDTKLPAQDIDKLVIPYRFPSSVGISDITKIKILIKNVVSGKQVAIFDTTDFSSQSKKFFGSYEAKININDKEKLVVGSYYKLQIAFESKQGEIGYYSNVGIIKIIEAPSVIIEGKTTGQLINYTVKYSSDNEKLFSYYWELYHNGKLVIQTKDQQYIYKDDEKNIYLTWEPEYTTINKNDNLMAKFYYTTENQYYNNCFLLGKRGTGNSNSNISGFSISASYNSEKGTTIIKGKQKWNNSHVSNLNFGLYRQSNFNENWIKVNNFIFSDGVWETVLFEDYTVEHGVSYRYAIGVIGYNIDTFTDWIQIDLEHIYLFDGEKQVCIKFNPNVSALKNVIQEQKVDTIGGKYPYFFRNGNLKYRELPISGLISYLMEEQEEDKKMRSLTPEQNPVQTTFSTALTAENFKKEKDFKLEIEKWLSNGQPKLFRSAQEGNYIIRLMNVSLSPNATVGRMLHTFSATGYEIDDFSIEGLQRNNLLSEKTIGEDRIKFNSEWEYIISEVNSQDEIDNAIWPDGWSAGKQITNTSYGQAPFSTELYMWDDAETILPYNNFVGFFRHSIYIAPELFSHITGLKIQIRYDENPIICINDTEVLKIDGFKNEPVTHELEDTTGLRAGLNYINVKIGNIDGGAGFDMAITPIYE